MKNIYAAQNTEEHRDNEGDGPEDETFDAIFTEILHIHLQPREEHYIIKSHLPEKLETAVPFKNVEPELPDQNTRQNHPDNVRNPQFPEQDRHKKDDDHHNEKYPRGVSDGQAEIYGSEQSHWVLIWKPLRAETHKNSKNGENNNAGKSKNG